jgi:hypothetical protein
VVTTTLAAGRDKVALAWPVLRSLLLGVPVQSEGHILRFPSIVCRHPRKTRHPPSTFLLSFLIHLSFPFLFISFSARSNHLLVQNMLFSIHRTHKYRWALLWAYWFAGPLQVTIARISSETNIDFSKTFQRKMILWNLKSIYMYNADSDLMAS